ncbi:hypothetical protein A0130_03880 [Leifsonia xyli]|nr:hypothetical protein A0130_03880 [Leifsonia xyli]
MAASRLVTGETRSALRYDPASEKGGSMRRDKGAVGHALPAVVIVLVAAGYVSCLLAVAVAPALAPEPDQWVGVPSYTEHPWLAATVAHALYWLVVLLAVSACIAAITWAGTAALRQLSHAERVAVEDLSHAQRG